jgi:hypothetical protein
MASVGTLRLRLRRRLPWALGPRVNAPLAQAKRATSSVATCSQACASWFAQGLVACLHSSWLQHSNKQQGFHAKSAVRHHRPNWSVKGTPTPARTSAAPNGRPLLLALGPRVNALLAQAKRATSSVATSCQACASWFAQGLVACLHSSWRQPSNQHTGNHAHAASCHHRPNWALQGTPPPLRASASPSGRP